MTTVPGTYFTKEQLEAARKVDNVSGGFRTGSSRMNSNGFDYQHDRKQYDKALAWYILAAMGNHSIAQNNIGALYRDGYAVPENCLCALKWFLKAAEQNEYEFAPNNIGELFENGQGVPLDKHKALEWYCRGGDKSHRDRLKNEGYHISETDKKKSFQQLRKETQAILDAEKKKLEEKQDKTQQGMEALVDIEITYNLVDGGKNAWKDVPVLSADDRQRYTKPVNNSDEILELKKQIQPLKQDKSTIESQANQIESLKQEKANLELQIKDKDKELVSLRNDNQSLQRGNSTVQQDMKTKDGKINSLQSENQELKLKIISFQTDNQSLKHRIDEYNQLVEGRDNKIDLLESEKREYHASSIQQTQALNSLEQEKQDKRNTIIEMERLKSSYSTLEQLLKSKEDTIMSLNRENQLISTANQGNQQGANEMVDTLKSLLQAKNSEIELNNLKMENALDKGKEKIKKLQKEIKRLKQHQQAVNSRETRPSSSTIVPEATSSNTRTNEDDPNNDFNYDTECGTEYSSSDDTSSEDEDRANDLNYDSDV